MRPWMPALDPSTLLDPALRSEATTRLIIEIAAAASGELDLDQILHEALDRLRRVVRLTGGSIALVDGDDLVDPGRDRAVRRRGARPAPAARPEPQLGRRRDARAVPDRRPVPRRRSGARARSRDGVRLVARRADRPPRASASGSSRSTRPRSTRSVDGGRGAARRRRRRPGGSRRARRPSRRASSGPTPCARPSSA